MGGGGSETRTEIDPAFKPYITYGLEEAKRLYQNMPQAPSTLAVGPSSATQQAMAMAQQRALQGSPLVGQAQNVLAQQMGYTSPYAKQIAELGATTSPYASKIEALGMSAADPSAAFYRSMMEGQPESEAARLTKSTASGAYLGGGSEFLQGALSQANRLAGEQFGESMKNLQAQAAAAGRYGSGAMAQQTAKSQDVLARGLAEQNQKAYLANYMAERQAQEAAMGRLGGFEQQAIANRFAGASGLTAGQQQALQTQLGALGAAQQITASDLDRQLGALGAAQNITAADLERQRAAAGMAPGLAAQDYADIQKLLQVGQGYEQYDKNAIMGQLQAQQLPLDWLRQATNIFYGAPMETKTATSGGK
jgi:hypothetical protein